MSAKSDPRALREAFGCFMTGVTVVTCIGKDGTPIGFTANSFSSVSLEPPLLLVSIARSSANLDAFVTGTGFAINVLAEHQSEISNRFARPADDRFAGIDWRNGPAGGPILSDVSAWFDCALHETVEAGDHVVLIGRVIAFEASAVPGLGYYRGAYIRPSTNAANLLMRPEVRVCAIIETDGAVLLVDDGREGVALPLATVGGEGVQGALSTLIAKLGSDAVAGPIYAVYEDAQTKEQILAVRCFARSDAVSTGVFVPLADAALEGMSDPAQHQMLERLMRERRDGIFGVYFGDHLAGHVSRSTMEGVPT